MPEDKIQNLINKKLGFSKENPFTYGRGALNCAGFLSETKGMAIGYKEMAEINLQLSEICFAAESEVEKLFRRADSGV